MAGYKQGATLSYAELAIPLTCHLGRLNEPSEILHHHYTHCDTVIATSTLLYHIENGIFLCTYGHERRANAAHWRP